MFDELEFDEVALDTVVLDEPVYDSTGQGKGRHDKHRAVATIGGLLSAGNVRARHEREDSLECIRMQGKYTFTQEYFTGSIKHAAHDGPLIGVLSLARHVLDADLVQQALAERTRDGRLTQEQVLQVLQRRLGARDRHATDQLAIDVQDCGTAAYPGSGCVTS